MAEITLNSTTIKRILGTSFEQLLTQSYSEDLSVLNWDDRTSRNNARHYRKREKEPFTGVMVLNNDRDESGIKSCSSEFRGCNLGPEIFASTFRSFFCAYTHGLEIELNINAFYDGRVDKLCGTNPSPPERIQFWIFGVLLEDEWYRNWHASRFSIKFYDEFISQSLSQKKIIDALEKYLSEEKLRMYDYDTYVGEFQLYEITKEILQLFKSINNFDSFLANDMDNLKDHFKNFKSIKSAFDCANLLFIYNPLFKEIMDYAFELYYFHAYTDAWYKKKYVKPSPEHEKTRQSSFSFKD